MARCFGRYSLALTVSSIVACALVVLPLVNARSTTSRTLAQVQGCRPNEVSKEERCAYVREHADCMPDDGWIPYLEVHYCYLDQLELASTAVFLLWIGALFGLMLMVAERFFCPSLELIAEYLRLPPCVAGATLLSFGNGAPDVFTQLAAISSGDDTGGSSPGAISMALSEPLGSGLFVGNVVFALVLFCSGAREVRVQRRYFLKDCLFYLAGVVGVLGCLMRGVVTVWQVAALAALYLVFMLTTVLMSRGDEPVRADPRLHEVPHRLRQLDSYLRESFRRVDPPSLLLLPTEEEEEEADFESGLAPPDLVTVMGWPLPAAAAAAAAAHEANAAANNSNNNSDSEKNTRTSLNDGGYHHRDNSCSNNSCSSTLTVLPDPLQSLREEEQEGDEVLLLGLPPAGEAEAGAGAGAVEAMRCSCVEEGTAEEGKERAWDGKQPSPPPHPPPQQQQQQLPASLSGVKLQAPDPRPTINATSATPPPASTQAAATHTPAAPPPATQVAVVRVPAAAVSATTQAAPATATAAALATPTTTTTTAAAPPPAVAAAARLPVLQEAVGAAVGAVEASPTNPDSVSPHRIRTATVTAEAAAGAAPQPFRTATAPWDQEAGEEEEEEVDEEEGGGFGRRGSQLRAPLLLPPLPSREDSGRPPGGLQLLWRRLERPGLALLSVFMPRVARDVHARYRKAYAVLLPPLLPTLLAMALQGGCGLSGGGACWAGLVAQPGWQVGTAVGVVVAGCVARWYPRKGHLHGTAAGIATVVVFLQSMVLLNGSAGELVRAALALGQIYGLSPSLLGASLLAWGNSVSDLVSNTTLARDGLPCMAITACFASPLFVLLAGLVTSLTYATRHGDMALPHDLALRVLYGLSAAILLMWALVVPLVFRFRLTKRVGFLALAVYAVYQCVYIAAVLHDSSGSSRGRAE
ncbi:hypothetical protein Agub_g5630 [Astrephomene gubernaculifera]|uniref:Sodium/calcium exchanger membrane region domain-containing protein n=1 Tax=Astrephomene gubernaculifera TaxID=47775 RepID=A0AAD3DMM5_9CHLO|nr:hypothetical protein Agub_g5630 [Astrephomene gubernaculifera]